MADSNYNMIKPVESLHNVAGLTPVKQREERNRQSKQKQQNPEKTPQEPYEVKPPEDQTDGRQNKANFIDYCA